MSILIKGMELPAECRECKMLTYYSTSGCSMCDITGNALARNFKPIPFDGRPDWCPLVEIPKTAWGSDRQECVEHWRVRARGR